MQSLSILIPWSDRPEIGIALSRNLAEFREHNAEVIMVNCGGHSQQLCSQISASGYPLVRQLDLRTNVFNKALALNLGASFSQGTLLFILDADTILNAGFFDLAIPSIDDKTYATVATVRETVPPLSEIVPPGNFVSSFRRTHQIEIAFADGSTICQETFSQDLLDGTKRSQGQTLLRKTHFLNIGGYNSAHVGWGWEDIDLQLRLRHSLGLRHLEVGGATHLSHDDNRRALFGRTRAASSMRNLTASLLQYSKGDFAGTYLEDVTKWRDSVMEVIR